jgi:hypothetical protein
LLSEKHQHLASKALSKAFRLPRDLVLPLMKALVEKCETLYVHSFSSFHHNKGEADDIIHQLMRLHPKALVVSEDGDFLLNKNLHLMLSTRYWRFSSNSNFWATSGRDWCPFALGVAYAGSGCDNTPGIKGLVLLKPNK